MLPRQIPSFASEAEEAQWWYDHREELAQDFVDAAKAGRLGEGSKARNARRMASQERQETEPSDSLKRAS